MNQNNKIYDFKKEDLNKVINIENKCHLTPWTKKNFTDSYNAKNLFKVLKNGNDIIGYYIALFSADECQLLNITVNLNLQKKGFGQQMMEDLFNCCKKNNIANIFLEVRKSNLTAIGLYEKNGFNELGIRANYYGNKDKKEDGILMGLAV